MNYRLAHQRRLSGLALSATAAFFYRPNSKICPIHFDRNATLFQMRYHSPESAQRPRLPDRARTTDGRTDGGTEARTLLNPVLKTPSRLWALRDSKSRCEEKERGQEGGQSGHLDDASKAHGVRGVRHRACRANSRVAKIVVQERDAHT